MQLLLTDLLVPRPVFDEWFADLALPHLRALLAHARRIAEEPPQPEVQRTSPATRWLANRFGFEANADAAPCAPALRLAEGGAPTQDAWWVADPVHFALARDHVLLGEHAPSIQADEALALAEAARPVLEDGGGVLDARTPNRWYLQHRDLHGLVAAEPLRALGRNVELWLPGGDPQAARRWRRMHTELQMLWHSHPVNADREARGQPPINGLWLWGGAPVRTLGPQTSMLVDAQAPAIARGFAQLAQHYAVQPSDTPSAEALQVHDQLSIPAAREDIGAWRAALASLDAGPLAALLAARAPCTLTVCGETTWRSYEVRMNRGWRFWERASLREVLGL